MDIIESIVNWLLRVISGLGFFLPIAIFAIFNLISGARKKQQEPPQRSQPAQGQRAAPPAPPVRPQKAPPEAMPFPIDLSPWFGAPPEPATPQASTPGRRDDAYRRNDSFRRDDAYRHVDDDTLRWGSAFAANDAERADSGLRWGSIFDEERKSANWAWEGTKWGWDESEWGGGFSTKRDTKPTITIG